MTADAPPTLTDGVVTLRARQAPGHGRGSVSFAVEAAGDLAGAVEVRDVGHATGELAWVIYAGQRGRGYATRAVRLLVEYAFAEPPAGLGFGRLQARVEPQDVASVRVARRVGLRNEGVIRAAPGTGDGKETESYLLLGRLRDDPKPTEGPGFRALLNSFLPRKRVIAQALVRDRDGRVLLCRPTYKDDWDLPGGVVEVLESPREAAGREVLEELGLSLPVGRLLLTDWLPPWSGWDDALCLVFDAGCHDPGILDGGVPAAGDPLCRVLHGRAGEEPMRRLHRPPARGSPRRAGP